MNGIDAIEYQWPYMRSFLPESGIIDQLARDTGALVRRREISSADTLLRLAFIYGFCGYSLRQTAAWAEAAGIVSVSDVALLKRFRASADLMCALVAQVLGAHVEPLSRAPKGNTRIRVVDGSTISRPGSSGSDWRVHLGFDLSAQQISSLELTDSSVGESFLRFQPLEGELLIGDRGYARERGLRWIVSQRAHFLVRIPWNNFKFETPDKTPFELFEWLRGVPEAEPSEIGIRLKGWSTPLRLLALRKSEPASEASRKRVLQYATNHTKKIDPRTLEAAGFTLLLTDQSEEDLPLKFAFELYRFRWQVELCFKRMKSVISLDQLPAKDPNLARMIIASKLLGTLLIEQLTQRYVSFSPWGYFIGPTPRLPLASV